MEKSIDNSSTFGVLLLTNLLKAYNCLPHELLIPKLDAYGFDKSSLKLIYSTFPVPHSDVFWA